MNNGNKGSGNRAILPATGGLSGGMPHHNEYRDKIIVCLSKNNA